MPRGGVSTEWIEDREDEIALILRAQRHVEQFRALMRVLLGRGFVTEVYYADALDSLALIDWALLVGKRNTAMLRNGREPP